MFTPVETSLGALLLHEASTAMLQDHGRVLGISGILYGAVSGMLSQDRTKVSSSSSSTAAGKPVPRKPASSVESSFRPAFLAGMLLAPAFAGLTGLGPLLPDQGDAVWAGLSLGRLALAGYLVGMGSKLGSGCTSGHMLCGLSRLSPRSIVAVATFFPTAIFIAHRGEAVVPFPDPYPPTLSLRAGSGLFPSWSTAAALAIPVVVYPLVRRILRNYLQRDPSTLLRTVPYFLMGIVFSLGLLISGMSSPLKVLSFLQFPNWGAFDPSLALVMLFGVVPNAIQYFRSDRKPFFSWESWQIPSGRDIDVKLLAGAVMFGSGWGLAGVCPGPAITAVGQILARSLGMAIGSSTGASQIPLRDVARGVFTFMVSAIGGMTLAGMYRI